MKITRSSALVLMLLLGPVVGPIRADIRAPLPHPDLPETKTQPLPEKGAPKPPTAPPKVDIKAPPTPPLPENQTSTTSVVMAGSFLALAIVVFGLVVFRARKTPPKPGE